MYNSVAVLGTGKTATIAVTELLSSPAQVIYVCGRTPEKSVAFCHAYDDPRVQSLPHINQASALDLIIDCSSAYPLDEQAQDIARIIATNGNYDEIRAKELNYNAALKEEQYRQLRQTNADVVMYTNPVDSMTALVANILGRKNVFGAGLQLDLDRVRKLGYVQTTVVGLHNKPIVLGATDHTGIQQGVDALLKQSRGNEKVYIQTQTNAMRELVEFLYASDGEFHLSVPQKTYPWGQYTHALGVPVTKVDGKIVVQNHQLSRLERKLWNEQRRVVRGSIPQEDVHTNIALMTAATIALLVGGSLLSESNPSPKQQEYASTFQYSWT